MDEREPGAEGHVRDKGPALSSAQQAHLDSYEQTRAQVRDLQTAAMAKRDTKDFAAALMLLFEGADELCAEAEAMPARMDEEAQDRSELLVRSAGGADLVLTGVLVALTWLGVLSGGGWFAVILMAAATSGLLAGRVAPPGTAHRQQRAPALASPVLGAVGVLIAGLTPWWWAAALLFIAAGIAVIIALSPEAAPGQEKAR